MPPEFFNSKSRLTYKKYPHLFPSNCQVLYDDSWSDRFVVSPLLLPIVLGEEIFKDFWVRELFTSLPTYHNNFPICLHPNQHTFHISWRGKFNCIDIRMEFLNYRMFKPDIVLYVNHKESATMVNAGQETDCHVREDHLKDFFLNTIPSQLLQSILQ